jgi:acyl-CoA synthetase (AMP-forming)/AMP-acid ligase II
VFSHPEAARRGYGITLKQMIPSMPLFHDASYQTILLAAMAGNSCYVLLPGVKFDPKKIFEAIETEQPLFMANVPTGWKKLVSHPDRDKYDLSSLRIAATGAGAASVDLKKKMFEAFPNALIADLFGQTEMTPVTSFRIDAGPETLKERSVGKSIVDIKVVDEDGDEVPSGRPGELMYRSSWVMMGYYKDEEKTGEAMEDGWFKSGDLGYIDEDGEVRLIDRKKECINTGGEKVFPLEVEEVIHQHPKVDDVCIIGVPDEEWGATVRAVVQLKKDEQAAPEDIIGFCRDKLAGYKIPRSVVFADELPLSPVGKVLRQKIREMYGGPAKQ